MTIFLNWTSKQQKILAEFGKSKELKKYRTVLPKTGLSIFLGWIPVS